ncbi:MAG: acyl-CoA dehydrogenase family protein [Promethearchaeota archaeon]
MDFLLGKEEEKIRDKVKTFAKNEIEPIADKIDEKEGFPREIFDKMGKEGLFGIPFPREDGGLGLTLPHLCTAIILEELGYASNAIAAIYDVHSILFGITLRDVGTESQKKRFLKPAIEGKIIGAFATTEPEASSDPSSIQARAKRKNNTWIINGHKRFITNSPVADYMITWAQTDEGLSGFIIDLKTDGVKIGDVDKKMGNRGQLTADVILKEVHVPLENQIGELGYGLKYALSTLGIGRIGIGAASVGLAQAALDESIRYAKERKQFAKKLAEFQIIQFKLADMMMKIETARLLTYKAAFLKDIGDKRHIYWSSMAKTHATEIAVDVAREAVQIFGGYGYIKQLGYDSSTYKVERIYRDAKIPEIYEGTNEIQRIVIAKSILGREYVKAV